MVGSVGIIGGGPSGLVVCKELLAAGVHDVTLFEASKEVGGVWASPEARWRPTGCWEELCMNINGALCEFSDFPWTHDHTNPKGDSGVGYNCTDDSAYGGHFPHCSDVLAYLRAYVKHFGLQTHIRVESQVVSVKRPAQGSGWDLTVKNTAVAPSTEATMHFDVVVVASGRFAKPMHPMKSALQAFSGRVMHSIEITSMREFDQQRVLVVGSSVSGADVAANLGLRGKTADLVHSVRRVRYYISKFAANKRPIDDMLFARMPVWLSRYLPESMMVKGFKSAVLENSPLQVTAEISGNPSLVPDDDVNKASLAIATEYVETLAAKKFVLKPSVASVDGQTVTFEDGTSADFDVVITGTGIDTELSFLDEDVRSKVEFTNPATGTHELALFKHCLSPEFEDLAFVGPSLNGVGPQWAVFEMNARFIARVFTNKMQRPSPAVLKADAEAFRRFRSVKHQQYDICPQTTEALAEMIGGLTPSTLQALWRPSQLLTGPLYSCGYRRNASIEGKEVAARAESRFQSFFKDPPMFTPSSESEVQ